MQSGRQTMEGTLHRWMADQLGVDEEELDTDASLADALAVDSLDMAALLAAFEDEFGIELRGTKVCRLATFGDFVALVRQQAHAVEMLSVPLLPVHALG